MNINNILFLSALYPHRYDAMWGLFVRKHAEAVALHANVAVVYVLPDMALDDFDIQVEVRESLTEIIVYYPFSKVNRWTKLSKAINWVRAYRKGLKRLAGLNFKPDVTHVNILTRAGLVALFLKWFKGIPYVITEHWSRYLPQNNSYRGVMRKMLTKLVVSNASALMPVSNNLAKAMAHWNLSHPNTVIVPNVVDKWFYPSKEPLSNNEFRILHVSCFDEKAKNVKGTLRALKELSIASPFVKTTFVGVGADFQACVKYAEQLDFQPGQVTFVGEQPPKVVAEYMRSHNMLLLFSNYENAPVVISEALVSGIPVLASRVGGIPEMINKRNGLLVNPGDEQMLLSQLNWMVNNSAVYDKRYIAEQAHAIYSYECVSRLLNQIYNQIIKNK